MWSRRKSNGAGTRVNIDKIHSVDDLHPQDNTGTNMTGGYLMKIDRLGEGESGFNAAGQTIVYVDPKEDDMKLPERAPQKNVFAELHEFVRERAQWIELHESDEWLSGVHR